MWLDIAIATSLIVWVVGGLVALNPLPKESTRDMKDYLNKIKHWVDRPWEIAFYAILVLSIATIGLLYTAGRVDSLVIVGGVTAMLAGIVGRQAPEGTLVREIAPELIGIAIGVVAIDQLYQIRLEQQDKKAIIRQIGSRSNDFALEAIRLSREQWLLFDGSLRGASIGAANLKGADFAPISLETGGLWEASLEGIDLGMANLQGANFMDANLQGAFLAGANLEGAYLVGANLPHVNLWEANLKGSYLMQANFEGADLGSCNFEGADLSESNLMGAFLGSSNLNNADLQNAVYNNGTAWPSNFDPTQAGAVNWDELSLHEREEWKARYPYSGIFK
ncbi:MAG: pentapeptide repeat-containing protein [Caldilineaceae bacterium]|nr:pentapeptide repeat-containing protein [Caldilineaceae bacterium]HRJ41979.1 pentapeptide repeat-containing protein [Caldilineaceae bacterium]